MKAKTGLTRFHNCHILRQGKIIKEDLWVRDGKLVNPEEVFYVEQAEADDTVHLDNFLIAPGFIDIQINGKFPFKSTEYKEKFIKEINPFLTFFFVSF